MGIELLSLENPVFSSYVFYGTVVLVKLIAVANLTTYRRLTKQVFGNAEDVQAFCTGKEEDKKIILNDPDVERARKNHLNDLENIIPFLFLAFFYILVDPNAFLAIWHFRVFTLSRILHTLFFQMASQPGRFYSYLVGLFVLYSLAIQIICALL